MITFSVNAQVVERIGITDDLKFYCRMNVVCPTELFVDEVNNYLYSQANFGRALKTLDINNQFKLIETKENISKIAPDFSVKLNQFNIRYNKVAVEINNEDGVIAYCKVENGICFTLKKDSGYIVYFVNENGIPGAIDTDGNIYKNTEAIEYLKVYDSEKYAQSRARAEKLQLVEKFDLCEVLIWGNTYYSTIESVTAYWTGRSNGHLYVNLGYPVQYDLQGNGYQPYFVSDGNYSQFVIVSPNGKWLVPPIMLHEYSEILKTSLQEKEYDIASGWYIGFGGNIYYYIAEENYTEVFRIRNTWDSTNLYALAINGYTEDFYGDYVKEVLLKMSKADLRLLRNTIFALYGVHFKSEDLAKHFDKQVWYTDKGLTSGDVTLPAHRQKLVEMIQKLEK
ncbi:MAG: YARHG domain-containing protein [Treponema sp.]|nr:YARHG domain-containing protein [Treponema sp.]